MSDWISVKDRLPEFTHDFGGFALVSDAVVALSESQGEIFADYSTHGWGDTDGNIPTDITHWFPIPKRPENKK